MNKKSLFRALAEDLGLRRRSEVWATRALTLVVVGLLVLTTVTSLQTLSLAEEISARIVSTTAQP